MDLYVRYKFLKFYHALLLVISIGIPITIVPIAAYKFGNWWLLLGIIIALIGQFLFVMKKGYSLIAIATLFCIGLWMKVGFSINQYATFYYFCLLFGFVSYGIMNEYNNKKIAVGEQVYESVKHELTHGETGRKIKKEIEEEMAKLRGTKDSN